MASDGNLWSVQAGSPAVLSVAAGRGLVNGTGAMAPLVATLGSVTATDSDVLARYTSGDYAHDQGALVAGFSGPGTSYAAGFDAAGGTPGLSILRSSNGAVTRVTGAPFPAVNGTAYWERLRVQRASAGDVVSVRAWPDGSPEPGTWALTFTDPTPLPAGLAGVAALDDGRGWSIDSFWAGLPPVVPASVPPPTPFAEDTFATRTVTDGWGTASDGNPWNQQTGWDHRLSVANGAGHVVGARDMSTMRSTLGAVTATDATLVARYTSQDYGNDDGHLLFRYSGPGSYYLAGLDSPLGSPELNVMRMSNGVQARVANVAFPAVNATSYWEMASIQTSGTTAVIKVKAWAEGTPEPTTWNLMYTDAAPLPGGTAGMEAWDSGKGWAVDSFAATPLVASSPTPAPTPAGTPTPAPSTAPASPPSPPTPTQTPSPAPAPTPLGPVGTDPSGVAMPTGNIPGWTPVFADDFTGASLNTSAWGTYNGQPGGDPGGCWDPSHVLVSGGMLHLETFQDVAAKTRQGCSSSWVSGGVSSARAFSQTYGKYLVRMRAGVGHGVSAIALLWPSTSGVWPPEVDFYEDGNGARTDMSATLHCGSNGNDSCQVQKSITVDFSQWHTLGVEWSPGVLNYTIDGQVWATVTNADGAVPTIPMEFDLQAQAGTCGVQFAPCPDSTTPSMVDYQIDWVAAYKPA